LAGARSGALANLPEERNLSWSERAGRRNSRGNGIFFADAFRPLRRVWLHAAAVAVASSGSFALLLLLSRGARAVGLKKTASAGGAGTKGVDARAGLSTCRAAAWPRRTCGPCPRAGRR